MRFHKKNWECKSPTKNSLKLEHERIEACQNTVQCLYLTGFMGFIDSIEYFTGLGYFLNSVWWILSVNDFCERAFKTHAAVWRFFFIHFCCNVYSALRLTNFEPQYLYLTRFMGFIHCNPLQGNYRVELLHREIPVIITGNDIAGYNFLQFWLHIFPVLLT